ncbi:MAG: amidohydrolase [Bacilli bacterium]
MLILSNIDGHTLDSSCGQFDAVAIADGRIVATGTAADLFDRYRQSHPECLDGQGAVVMPGFIDSHLHVSGVASSLSELDVSDASSVDDLLGRITEYARTREPHQWIVGGGFDENRFPDSQLPTLAELDQAVGDTPLFLARVCRHVYLANSAAFAAAGVSRETPDPIAGFFGRNAYGGWTGAVYEQAALPFMTVLPDRSDEEWVEIVSDALLQLARLGITEIHSDDCRYLGGLLRTRTILTRAQQRVPIRIHELLSLEDWRQERLLQTSLPTRTEDELLAFGAVKLFADGSFGGRTAWLKEPYADASHTGQPTYTKTELLRLVEAIHADGFAVAIHAIGDAALDAVLDALEIHPPRSGALPDRIVHASLFSEEAAARAAKLAAVIDVQPRFIPSDLPWLSERLGSYRVRRAYPLRSLLQAGLMLAGGSDAPVEAASPLLGMHAAATRRVPGQTEVYGADENLTIDQAICLYCEGGAAARGKNKRALEPGSVADLVLLSRNPFECQNADELLQIQILGTVVAGRPVYWAARE